MTTLTRLFQYKAWADGELHSAVEALPAGADPAQHQDAIRILNHIHVVDRIFMGHLQGTAHGFSATNTPTYPPLAELNWASQEADAWLVDYTHRVSAAELAESIAFTFTDGDTGSMTREEMLMHLIAHGTAHRGQVSRIVLTLGGTPPRDLFTKFLHQSEPQRRTP